MYFAFRSALLLLIVAFPMTMSAQTNFPLMSKENKTLLSFQFQHPFMKSTGTDFTALSGTYDLTLVAPVSSSVSIIGTLPYAGYSASSKYFSESAGGLANISVGVSKSSASGTSILTGKVFLPTAPSDGINSAAIMYGFYHRFYELEQFLPEALSIQTQYFYRKNFNGFLLGGVIGGSVLIPTGNALNEMEVLARYGVSMGYESNDVRIVAEFIGIGILTESRILAKSWSEHFIAFGGQWSGGSVVKPKLKVQLPLGDDLSSYYGWALTLGCDFVLP